MKITGRFADRDMFAQFAEIGVGHLTQNVLDQVPALSLETGKETLDEDDIEMQEIDDGHTADKDNAGSGYAEKEEQEAEDKDEDKDEDEDEDNAEETLSQASEDDEGMEKSK